MSLASADRGSAPIKRAAVHPVDEVLPAPRLFALGLQHVLAMYAGAIAVPLLVGAALKLSPEQIIYLINADLLVSGILRTNELQVWFLAEHLVDVPVVRAD